VILTELSILFAQTPGVAVISLHSAYICNCTGRSAKVLLLGSITYVCAAWVKDLSWINVCTVAETQQRG
jgi:hypothetical protein